MKTEKEGGRGKSGVHKADENRKGEEAEWKAVFIRQMKAEKEGGRGKSGVHKQDENW